MDYSDYETKCAAVRQENKVLLEGFELWLKEKGLGENTVSNHLNNIDFYINDFLLYYDVIPAAEGADEISSFLGNWFIRKAMWASESSIRSNAASLKKFYQYLYELDMVPREELAELKLCIKEDLPDWLEELRRFDSLAFDF